MRRQQGVVPALLSFAAFSSGCILPTTPLSNTITNGFGLQVQNTAHPEVHNRYLNFWFAGGVDEHLFLSPAGDSVFNLVLNSGVLGRDILHAVINGEYTPVDNTTKMFMTDRGDPRAIYTPVWGCNPDTDKPQVELSFQYRETSPVGGHICVRQASGNRYEFRYSPPGNPTVNAANPCIAVKLAVVRTGTVSTTTTTSRSTTTSTTRTSTSTTRTSTSTSSTSTSTPLPYTDMTSKRYAFVGCAPEERRATDAPGRTLTGPLYADDLMAVEKCIDFCKGKGYKYAGTEFARECWCGNTLAPGRQPKTTKASLANCNFKCGGNNAEYCGGDAWLSLYQACPAGAACVNQRFT